jgi:eukaryotic-like serine/threonine-protein kinase
VYALAVVGYEMLTGTRPFAGDSMITTALAHVSQPAPPLPESVPEPLSTTVMAGLAKDPNQRPESAAAFAEALRLPEGETPAHLTAAAASAVAPVVAGIGGLLTPDPQGATALIPMSPVTPAIPAAAVTTVDTARRRRRMLIGGAAGLAALVLVLVIAFASVGQAKADTTPAPQATHTPTAPAPAPAPATAATTAAPQPSATTARPVNAATAKAPAAPAPAPAPKAAHTKGKGHGGGKKK